MGGLLRRLLSATRAEATGRRGRHRRRPEVAPLEGRAMPSVVLLSATATPQYLPDNGQYVKVTVTGYVYQVVTVDLRYQTTPPSASQLAQIVAEDAAKPAPSPVTGFVIDQYRRDEPKFSAKITHLPQYDNTFFVPYNPANPTSPALEGMNRSYAYTATFYLHATKSTAYRQYDITVASSDAEAASSKSIAVVVPPSQNPPKTTTAKAATAHPSKRS